MPFGIVPERDYLAELRASKLETTMSKLVIVAVTQTDREAHSNCRWKPVANEGTSRTSNPRTRSAMNKDMRNLS